MAVGYLAYATQVAEGQPAEAMAALRRAKRNAASPELVAKAESALLGLQAQQLLERNVADQSLLRRALELDPPTSARVSSSPASSAARPANRATSSAWRPPARLA
jgi:hypothetical protein